MSPRSGGLPRQLGHQDSRRLRPETAVLPFLTTSGQTGDPNHMIAVLDQIRVRRPSRGRPRTRPARVRTDRAWPMDSDRVDPGHGRLQMSSHLGLPSEVGC